MTKKPQKLLTLDEVLLLQHLLVNKIGELTTILNRASFSSYHNSESFLFKQFQAQETELNKCKDLFDKLLEIQVEDERASLVSLGGAVLEKHS